MSERKYDPLILPDDIGAPMHLLTDAEIIAAVEQKYFFDSGFDADRVRQASYELTLGYARSLNDSDIRECGTSRSDIDAFWIKESGLEKLCINPFQSCNLLINEQIRLPNNVVGRVNARGQLFQRGLVVESTYIDPGFFPEDEKSVHLMVFNATNRVVKLPRGVPIARLEFMKLTSPVQKPHGGRRAIHRPEAEDIPPPLPSISNERSSSIDASFAARNSGFQMLAADHLMVAVRRMSKDLQGVEDERDIHRLTLYIFGLVIIWLFYKVYDFGVWPTAALVREHPSIKEYIDTPITGLALVFLPVLARAWRKSFWSTVKRSLRRLVTDE